MSYLVQRSCVLNIKAAEFVILAILMQSEDGDNWHPVLQVQNPKSGEILYFGMKKEFLVEFDEGYELVAK